MKYFKFNEPYFALISADSKEMASAIYLRDVCEAEKGYEMKEISQIRAFKLINNAKVDDEFDREELKKASGLLLIDGCLV